LSREETRFDQLLQPRDILTPAATFVGLVLTAIGVSTAIVGFSTVLQTFLVALILVVVLFVGAALLTCFSSLRNSYGIFKVAIVLYTGGWFAAGVFICLLLVGYAWGIQILQIQIPNIPTITVEELISIAMSTLAIVFSLVVFKRTRIDKKQLTASIEQLAEDRSKAQTIAKEALVATSNDPKMAFLKAAIDLENTLRKMALEFGLPQREANVASIGKLLDYLASNKAIDLTTGSSMGYVRSIRNKVVHSAGDVSPKDAMLALDLAATLLAKLSPIKSSNTT